jgi:predicted GNAT superfamily acetyltransferase
MQNIAIREAAPGDFESICALNLAEVQHTSGMDVARLQALDRLACYHKLGCVEGQVVAFLLAMRHDARYENDNFIWFSRHYPRFLYIEPLAKHALQG